MREGGGWQAAGTQARILEGRLPICQSQGVSFLDCGLDRIEETLEKLSTFSERGAHPKELLGLGIRDYRQTFFKPYRMMYRIIERRVHVYLIVDGRRDLQTLLARRVFGA